jgi:hypothetical protein
MNNRTRKLLWIAPIAAVSISWGALVLAPIAAAPRGTSPTQPDAVAPAAVRASESRPPRSQPSAADRAAVDPEPSTAQQVEQLRPLDDTELSKRAAEVDEQIERAGYVQQANAGVLAAPDIARFKAMLRQRNAVQIAKAERLLAKLEAPVSR